MDIPADQCLIAETGLAAFSGRVPESVRDKIEIRFRRERSSFILFEWRPRYINPREWAETPVAKFTYVATTGTWRLLWMRRDLRWHGYEPLSESRDIARLFEEVDEDPWGCFWG
jgi:hypothetical protein